MPANPRQQKHFRLAGLGIVAAVSVAGYAAWRTAGPSGVAARAQATAQMTAEALQTYCLDCHNRADNTAGLTVTPDRLDDIGAQAQIWEKIAHKLEAGSMPPVGEPRPGPEEYASVIDYLHGELDSAAAAAPNPGTLPQLHRLTRTEYRNAIRDLLALEQLPAEMDYELLLPADNSSSGFDNISELLFVSPVVMERYLGAAQKIARLAVGDMRMPAMVNRHRLPLELPQDVAFDGLAFGTRGGLQTESWFPLDAQYTFHVEMAGFAREQHTLEISIDGERIAAQPMGRGALEITAPVQAGPHEVGIAFVERTRALDESTVRVQRRSRGSLPALELITIAGPHEPTGPGTTPSRERIFTCQPAEREEEADCARQILGTLARRAYRRPATADDIDVLMAFYEQGRNEAGIEAGFEAGIQRALERVLVSPQFLYRIERIPQDATAGTPFEISPLELASRLSFFLWSSLPDDRLLELAASGELNEPAVLESEVERMLADEKATALVENFAAQWLFLRDVEIKDPDLFIFRDYDEGLRAAFARETELFLESVLLGDASVLELIGADYTFLNERLADHYGIPFVKGSRFRRVTLPEDSHRIGLLGHGSVLTLTSYPTRTSPVLRGKYVLDNLLAAPPPPPPADVPALVAEEPSERATQTLREAMAAHRASPECAGCHAQMDPIGFAFEHFDAVGRWRDTESGLPIETASDLPDGSTIDGIEGVRQMLLAKPERFVSAVTEKLLMYALGRNIQYYDRPAIRAIVRGAEEEDFRFAALVKGIVGSVPFRMRMAPAADSLAAATSGE